MPLPSIPTPVRAAAAVLTLALALAACGGGDAPPETTPVEVPHRNVLQAGLTGLVTPGGVAADTELLWQRLWDDHARGLTPAPARPAVDFTREQVMGVVLGERPGGCRHVQVTRVLATDRRFIVRWREVVATPDTACTQQGAQQLLRPVALVAVPRGPSTVFFEAEPTGAL